MSSGTFRELATAFYHEFKELDRPRYPLPQEFQTIIGTYLGKHAEPTDSDSQRLHVELRNVYERHVKPDPIPRLAAFLALLRDLRPVIRGMERSMEWWKVLLQPTIDSLSNESPDICDETRELLLSFLIVGDDEEDKRTSVIYAKWLFNVFVDRTYKAEPKDDGSRDEQSMVILGQLDSTLILFGKSKPKEFLRALDAIFIGKQHRLAALELLCHFVTSRPPDLQKVLETPILDHILKCLMLDTSTTVISLALTSLIMFLPHVPGQLVPYLPQLFIIYNRLLCWDRYYPEQQSPEEEKDESVPPTPKSPQRHQGWEVLDRSFDTSSSQPEILHYWTFLYGLYPLNLMEFVKRPNEYLQRSQWGQMDGDGLDQAVLCERSKVFANMHLVHENFFTTSPEGELKDLRRWAERDPVLVVADCIGLCATATPNVKRQYETNGDRPDSISDGRDSRVPTEDIPWDSLVSINGEDDAATIVASSSSLGVRSPGRESAGFGIAMDRKSIYDSRRPGAGSRAYSNRPQSQWSFGPEVKANGTATPEPRPGGDSPTIPSLPHSNSELKLHTLLGQRITTVVPPYRLNGHTKGDSTSAAEQNGGRAVDSPSLRTKASGSSLQREVILLRNDLNFERYLKEQHLSHIGQLQRKQISESRIEGELRAHRHTNKLLKQKLADVKDAHNLLKQENTRTRQHSKKWEADLSARLKNLREQQKQWNKSEGTLQAEMNMANQEIEKLRTLVRESEGEKHRGYDRLRAMEATMADLDKLRAENDRLNRVVREYQEMQVEFERAKQQIIDLDVQKEQIRLRYHAREGDYEKQVIGLQKQVKNAEYQARPRPGGINSNDGSGGGGGAGSERANLAAMMESAVAPTKRKLEQERRKFLKAEADCIELRRQLDDMSKTVEKFTHLARFNKVREEPLRFDDHGPAVGSLPSSAPVPARTLSHESVSGLQHRVLSHDRLDAMSGSDRPSATASSHSNEAADQLANPPLGSNSFPLAPNHPHQQQQYQQLYPLDRALQGSGPGQQQQHHVVPVMANQNLPRNIADRPLTSVTAHTDGTGRLTNGSQESGGAGTEGEGEGGEGGDGGSEGGIKREKKITVNSEVRMRGRGGTQNIGSKEKKKKKEKKEGGGGGKLAGLFS